MSFLLPPQVEAISRCCCLSFVLPTHLNRWPPCYQAVLHFSSPASISALLPPCLAPGEVVPVGWRRADPGLCVTVGTGTGWRRERCSPCSLLTPAEGEGQNRRTTPTSGRPSQDKTSLEGKGTLCLRSSHRHMGDGGSGKGCVTWL